MRKWWQKHRADVAFTLVLPLIGFGLFHWVLYRVTTEMAGWLFDWIRGRSST